MKIIVCTKYGPPDALQIREAEKPFPGDTEVLIRVRATSVTAADYRIRGAMLDRTRRLRRVNHDAKFFSVPSSLI